MSNDTTILATNPEDDMNTKKNDDSLAAWIDSLDLPEWLSDMFARLKATVLEAYDRVIEVGQRVLELVKYAMDTFPRATVTGAMGLVLIGAAAAVPVLGPVLAPFMAFLTAVGVIIAGTQDFAAQIEKAFADMAPPQPA